MLWQCWRERSQNEYRKDVSEGKKLGDAAGTCEHIRAVRGEGYVSA